MRIRNLYDPPTLKDRDPVVPWAPNYKNVSSKITDEGCEITVTGEDIGWLYPPEPVGVTVLTRLCGFNDNSLITLLQNAGLPLVFAASDHPY